MSSYSEGSSEEEMNEEYLSEPSEDEIEDQESGENEGMEDSDEENNSDKEESNEESDVGSDKEDEDEKVTVDEIKSQIAEGKKELTLEGEFTEEGFVYLLELLKPNSETTITSLYVAGKFHEHKTQVH